MNSKYIDDDVSEGGSDDTSCALSEVSCDDAAPKYYSSLSLARPPQAPVNVQAPLPVRTAVPVALDFHPRLAGIKDDGIQVPESLLSSSAPVAPGGSSSNSSKGGMLDATRTSTVANMLFSAKQKQVDSSDGSDDDWE